MDTVILRKFMQFVLAVVLICGLTALGFTQKSQDGKNEVKQEKTRNIISTTSNELQGEVSWINKKYIAIVYNRDAAKGTEEEILLPLDESVKLQHKRKLDEIAVGDIVSIQYDEETEEDAHNEKKQSRKAKVITFVKPAVKKLSPEVLPEDIKDDSLSFKGIIED